jgi:hypothetical protein
MGELMPSPESTVPPPFNGKLEVGLRALCVLTAGYPDHYSVQRLTALDYLVVHSDDVPGGPISLHPRTPYRGGEILVRRGVLQEGLALYWSRALIERQFAEEGLYYAATEQSAAFLDALQSRYVDALRDRANWLVDRFGPESDEELADFVRENVGEWGAEFTLQSVLREEEPV